MTKAFTDDTGYFFTLLGKQQEAATIWGA